MKRKLTKKQRENIRNNKYMIFERSLVGSIQYICEVLMPRATMPHQRRRLSMLRKRIEAGFKKEYVAMGLMKSTDCFFPGGQKRRMKMTIPA